MFYWLTSAGASSAGSIGKALSTARDRSRYQAAVQCFQKYASERWVQKRYQNLVYWNELDRGGHFAAFERPDVFVAEIRACFARMSLD